MILKNSQTVDIMDNVSVYLRVRPFTDEENEKLCQSCVTIQDDTTVVLNVPEDNPTCDNSSIKLPISSYNFSYTKTFGPDISQKEFFCGTVLDCACAFLNGQDALVLSHGPRKSGRTYTIQGDRSNPGLLPRLVDVLFNSVLGCMMKEGFLQLSKFSHVKKATTAEKMFESCLKEMVLKQHIEQLPVGISMVENGLSKSENSMKVADHDLDPVDRSINEMFEKAFATLDTRLKEEETLKITDEYRYSIWVSFAELNGENIYDLLDHDVDHKNSLPIGIDQDGKPYIEGLLRISVATADEALRVVLIGQRNHVMSAKKRDCAISHFLFCVELVRVTSKVDPSVAIVNRLVLCDVGSPDDCKLNEGKNEGANQSLRIDPSYLVLERCIDALRQKNELRIPYEESKLTRLLCPFFTREGSKIKIAVTVGPATDDFLYTLNALKFSSLTGEVVSKCNMQSSIPMQFSLISNKLDDYGVGSEASTDTTNTFVDCELLDLLTIISEKKQRDEKRITCIYDYLVDAVQIMRTMLISQHKDKAVIAEDIRQQMQREFFEHVVEIERHFRSVNSKRKCYRKYWWKHYLQMMLLNVSRCNDNVVGSLGNKDKDESADGKYDLSVENRLLNVEVKSLRENLQKLSRSVAEMQLENSRLKLLTSVPLRNEESPLPNSAECIKLIQDYRNEIEEMKKLRTVCAMRNEINEQQLMEKVRRLERETRVRQKLLLSREQTIADLERQKQQLASKLRNLECLTRLTSNPQKSCSCRHTEDSATVHRKRRLQSDNYYTVKKFRKPFNVDHRWKVSSKLENVDDDEWFLYDFLNSHTDSQHESSLPKRKMKCRLIVRCEKLEFQSASSIVKSSEHARINNNMLLEVKSTQQCASTGWQKQLVCQHISDAENQSSEDHLLDGWNNQDIS